jgi:hypothetical protein
MLLLHRGKKRSANRGAEMKKMVYAFIFCMLLTVPASAQPAPQTGKSGKQALQEEKKAQHLCQKHANWNINDCRQVAQGHTWIGMTEGMLYALYGRPRNFSTEQTEDGTVTVLRYTNELPNWFAPGQPSHNYITVFLNSRNIVADIRNTNISKF